MLKETAELYNLHTPEIIIYNFETNLYDIAKTVPGYEIIPFPVMNILLDYGGNDLNVS